MNQLVTISYEDRIKAHAKAVRSRLYGKPKVVNVIKEVLAQKALVAGTAGKVMHAEADAHVKAYRLWQECAFKRTTMMEYAEKLCADTGVTLSQLREQSRNRALVQSLDYAVFEMKLMFPHKPFSEICRVFNRDPSTLVRSVQREEQRRGLKPTGTEAEIIAKSFPTLEQDLSDGMTLREISLKYEVGVSTISRKVRTLGLMHLLQTKTKPVNMEFIEMVRVAYAEGQPLKDIGARYSVSVRTIGNWKETFGWPDRRPRKVRAA